MYLPGYSSHFAKSLVETLNKSLLRRLAARGKSTAEEPLREFDGQIERFFCEVLGIRCWSKMREIIRAYEDPEIKEIYIVACHGVSKTMTLAGLVDYHFSVKGSSVFTTAPTKRQVNELLWKQIRINRMKAATGYRLPGRVFSTPKMRVKNRPDWTSDGFSPKDQDSAQGPHQDNLLIAVDEAAGVPEWLWTAIKGWMTNPGCKLIAIGNPAMKDSYFRRQFFQALGRKGTIAIYINAHDSPNVSTWEDGTLKKPEEREDPIPGLASDQWLEDRAEEWGKDSPDYQMKALGKWLDSVDDRAIPMTWIWESFRLTDQLLRNGQLVIGDPDKVALDVARTGVDKCALGALRGRLVSVDKYWHEPDAMKTAEELHHFVASCPEDNKPESAAVDINAVGGPVADRANQLKKLHPTLWGRCRIKPIDWSAAPDDPKSAKNLVAELYLRLRRNLDPDKKETDRVLLPTEAMLAKVGLTRNQLAAQLNARKCHWDEYNIFHVESKKEMRKRQKELKGATSPDVADMIAALMDKRQKRRMKFAGGKAA
jgi:hypothetical protein